MADRLLQISFCRQQLVDAMQAGRDDQVLLVARVVFRLAGALEVR